MYKKISIGNSKFNSYILLWDENNRSQTRIMWIDNTVSNKKYLCFDKYNAKEFFNHIILN